MSRHRKIGSGTETIAVGDPNASVDITSEEQTELDLAESEARYRALVENSPSAIIVDRNGKVSFANPACVRLFGASSPEDLLGTSALDLFETDSRPLVEEYLLVDSETVSAVEVCVVRLDGTSVDVEAIASPFLDEGVPSIQVVLIDIAERKLAREQEAQRIAVSYSRSLIEANLDSLMAISPDGKITDVNAAAEKTTGVPRDRLIGTDFAQYFTDPDKARAGYKCVLRKGVVRDYPLSLRNASGPVIDVEYNATVYRDDAGEIQGVFAAARDITERKRAERELRQSEEKFATAFRASPDLLCITRVSDGMILEVNEGYEDLLGYIRAGSIGKTTTELSIWVDVADRARFLATLEETGRVTDFETTLRHKDGTVIPVIMSARTFELQGEACVLSVVADITERKRAEEVIRTNQAELVEAQRIGHFGNFDWDARTDAIVWSEEYYRIYGFDPKQPPPGYEEHLKVYSPESAARLDAAVNKSMQTGEPYELDLKQVHPDGTTRWATARGEVKRDADGKIIGLHGTAQDITERKMAEEQYRDVLETAMDGFWLSDSNGHLLKVNATYCRMSGYSETELLSMSISDLDVIETPEEVDAHAARILVQGSDRFESKHRRKDGSVFDVESSVRYQPESGLLSSFQRDITDRKTAAELAVRQAEHIAKTLTSVVDITSSIVELRDPYTAGHERRVSELAVRIAEEIGMDVHAVDDIRIAGMLHDMGKSAIPTEILSKPGKLSAVEFELIKSHAEVGYHLAVTANLTASIAEMIHQHHERLDGSGYPQGLVGDKIAIGGRILAMADVMEAMMSHRPYRAALGMDAALQELERGSGTLYDAEIVRVCATLFREKHFEFET